MAILMNGSFGAAALLSAALLQGCTTTKIVDDDDGTGSGGGGGSTAQSVGLPGLGSSAHSTDSVDITDLVSEADPNLDVPRDLAINPLNPDELWVVARTDDAVVVYTGMDSAQPTSVKYAGPGHQHFMAQPSGIAFGDNGFLATIHETDQRTQGPDGTPPDFMGPTLWKADLATFNAGHASHHDMLHNSPNGMGITWQVNNVYWVFDGAHSSITMYDFEADHGAAGADHSTSTVKRYVEGTVLRVPDVPSHMAFDPANNDRLYIADTGHARIAVLDTLSGTDGAPTTPNYDSGRQIIRDGATITTWIDGQTLTDADAKPLPMTQPSGMAIHDGHMYVGDAATGTIFAFNMDGKLVDWLPLGLPPGALQGLAIDAAGDIYFVDAIGHRVVKISAKPAQ